MGRSCSFGLAREPCQLARDPDGTGRKSERQAVHVPTFVRLEGSGGLVGREKREDGERANLCFFPFPHFALSLFHRSCPPPPLLEYTQHDGDEVFEAAAGPGHGYRVMPLRRGLLGYYLERPGGEIKN